MGNLSVDEKLLLIQKMRENNNDNQQKIQKRNNILTGGETNLDDEWTQPGDISFGWLRTFKIRLAISVLAFVAFVALDYYNIRIKGHTAGEVISTLQTSYELGIIEESMEAWSENIISQAAVRFN